MVVPHDVWNAAVDGQLAPVQAWFDSGERDANDVDSHGRTLIYRALQMSRGGMPRHQRNAIVRLVVAQGADVNVNQASSRGADVRIFSYLHQAMKKWNEGDVDLLLELGADATVNPDGPLEYAFTAYQSTYFLFIFFSVAVLRKLLRAGASLDFMVADQRLRHAIVVNRSEDYAQPNTPLYARFIDVDERVREITAGIDLIAGVRQDGSYRAYLRRPHKLLLRIRSLRARGRAHATRAAEPYVARLLDPSLPSGPVWGILTFWRDAG